MINTNQLGTIGELKSILVFMEMGYSIYSPLSGKESYDFIACKNDQLIRVQVKSTSKPDRYGSYTATLKSVRPNRTKTRVIKFDNSKCDILAVYIKPLDVVCFVHSLEVKATHVIAFRENRVNNRTNLISDHTLEAAINNWHRV